MRHSGGASCVRLGCFPKKGVSGRRVVSVWNVRLASLVELGTALSYFTMPWRVWNTIHFPLGKCGGRS